MDGGGGSSSGTAAFGNVGGGDEVDPMTMLSLAPPGTGGASGNVAVGSRAAGEEREERTPAEFWEAMREVIAREVREYVTTSFTDPSGFR